MEAQTPPRCRTCGDHLTSELARFCESCGAEVAAGAAAIPPGAAGDPCRRCGGEVGSTGYCATCGVAALEPVAVEDRGTLAAGTHRGRRHHRNEDAVSLALTEEGWPVLVVADGVSLSPNPHLASNSAAEEAAGHLAGKPFAGHDSLISAVEAAQRAVRAAPAVGDPSRNHEGDDHPACTLAVAVLTDREVYAANIGDTRAYLVRARGEVEASPSSGDDGGDRQPGGPWAATRLTVDDSIGHALTGWLGADAEPSAHTTRQPVNPGDLVLVCSDGLWNYAPDDLSLAQLVGEAFGNRAPTPEGAEASEVTLAEACVQLTSWAIDQGGADNVSVALAWVPATSPASDPSPGEEQ